MLIEERGLRILTDPGTYSEGQNSVPDIHCILITHEHQDHLHIDSLKKVLNNNPLAKIFTNKGVGVLLEKESIPYTLLESGESVTEKGVSIEAFGEKHAAMHPDLPRVDNTGFLIGKRLFYPGDALTSPSVPVEMLALPVAGPWLKLSEAIEYTKEIHPKICFPVHEGILKSPGSTHLIPPKILEPLGIKFLVLGIGKETSL